MLSIRDLENQEGVVWAPMPPKGMSPPHSLLWWMSQELSAMLELSYNPEDMREVAGDSVFALQMADLYFAARGAPRPRALAHVLILIERAEAGLDPRGI